MREMVFLEVRKSESSFAGSAGLLCCATLREFTERTMSYHNSWGKILSRHVQHRCKICADGTGNPADLVCADAWHADDEGYPLFEE